MAVDSSTRVRRGHDHLQLAGITTFEAGLNLGEPVALRGFSAAPREWRDRLALIWPKPSRKPPTQLTGGTSWLSRERVPRGLAPLWGRSIRIEVAGVGRSAVVLDMEA